jgi:hypothetical protein
MLTVEQGFGLFIIETSTESWGRKKLECLATDGHGIAVHLCARDFTGLILLSSRHYLPSWSGNP